MYIHMHLLNNLSLCNSAFGGQAPTMKAVRGLAETASRKGKEEETVGRP